ncbi:MAG: PDZ domain-containing protein [Acidobacteria bacterium]|nr:PDZ domain-containing protein [Acidobacteriota bacterium]
MKRLLVLMLFTAFAIPAAAQEAGWIGVHIEDQADRGAIIRGVEPNSPAAKAGLREGDVIIQYNKEDVIGVQQLTRLVRETPAGRTVEVRVRRENREQTFQVTTERGPVSGQRGRFELNLPNARIFTDRLLRDFPRVQVNTTYVQSGVRIEQLTDQLRDFFGVLSNSGVLVTSVDQGSAAAKAGLKAGDVVTTVDGKTVRSPADFSREMRAGGSKMTLKVVRDKQEREIAMER